MKGKTDVIKCGLAVISISTVTATKQAQTISDRVKVTAVFPFAKQSGVTLHSTRDGSVRETIPECQASK